MTSCCGQKSWKNIRIGDGGATCVDAAVNISVIGQPTLPLQLQDSIQMRADSHWKCLRCVRTVTPSVTKFQSHDHFSLFVQHHEQICKYTFLTEVGAPPKPPTPNYPMPQVKYSDDNILAKGWMSAASLGELSSEEYYFQRII